MIQSAETIAYNEDDDYLLDIKDIETGQLIGQGQFATVYLGKYFGEYVAVKKQVRDDEIENRVAQELKAFVITTR